MANNFFQNFINTISNAGATATAKQNGTYKSNQNLNSKKTRVDFSSDKEYENYIGGRSLAEKLTSPDENKAYEEYTTNKIKTLQSQGKTDKEILNDTGLLGDYSRNQLIKKDAEKDIEESATARKEREASDENYKDNYYALSNDNGETISLTDYKGMATDIENRSNALNDAYKEATAKYSVDKNYDDYSKTITALKADEDSINADIDKYNSYNKYGYNGSYQNEYDENKEKIDELSKQAIKLKTSGGSTEDIKNISTQIATLTARNSELETLVNDIKNVQQEETYNYLKENGTQSEIADFEREVSTSNDNPIWRVTKTVTSQLALNPAQAVLDVVDIGGDVLGEVGGDALNTLATKFKNDGVIDEEALAQINNLADKMKEFDATSENAYSQILREYRAKSDAELTNGVASSAGQLALQVVDGSLENVGRVLMLGEVLSLAEIGVNTLGDSYKENIENGYSQGVALANATAKGALAILTEKNPITNLAKRMGLSTDGTNNEIASNVEKKFIKLLTDNFAGQFADEFKEEIEEGVGDYLIDYLTYKVFGEEGTAKPEFEVGDVLKSGTIAGLSGGLSGGVATAINYAQTSAYNQQVREEVSNQIGDIHNEQEKAQALAELDVIKEDLPNVDENTQNLYGIIEEVTNEKIQKYEDSSVLSGAVKQITPNEVVIPTDEEADNNYKEAVMPTLDKASQEQEQKDLVTAKHQAFYDAVDAVNEVNNNTKTVEQVVTDIANVESEKEAQIEENQENQNKRIAFDVQDVESARKSLESKGITDYEVNDNTITLPSSYADRVADIETQLGDNTDGYYEVEEQAKENATPTSNEDDLTSDIKIPGYNEMSELVDSVAGKKGIDYETQVANAVQSRMNNPQGNTIVNGKDLDTYATVQEKTVPRENIKKSWLNKDGSTNYRKVFNDLNGQDGVVSNKEMVEKATKNVDDVISQVIDGTLTTDEVAEMYENKTYSTDDYQSVIELMIVGDRLTRELDDAEAGMRVWKVQQKVNDFAGRLVESNRELYAMSSPVSKEAYLMGVMNNIITETEAKQHSDKYSQIIEDKFAEKINDLASTTDNQEFRKGLQNLISDVYSVLPATLSDKARSLRMWGMLSGPKTIIKNIVINETNVAINKANNAVKTIIESSLVKNNKIDVNDRTAIIRDSNKTKALKNATLNGNNLVSQLYEKYNTDAETKYQTPDDKNTIPATLQNWEKRALSDEGIKKRTFFYALDRISQSRGFDLTTEDVNSQEYQDICELAMQEAMDVVNHNATWMSRVLDNVHKKSANGVAINKDDNFVAQGLNTSLKKLKQDANKGSIVAKAIDTSLDTIVSVTTPFYKTQLSGMQKFVDYSPISLGKAVAEWNQMSNGTSNETTAQNFVNHLSKGLTGTALMGVAMGLSMLGLVKWEKDDEDYSGSLAIKIPGRDDYMTISFLDPISVIFAKGAVIGQELQENGFTIDTIGNIVGDYMDILTEDELSTFSSFFEFIQNCVNLTKGEDEYGEYGLPQFVADGLYSVSSQYIPAILRDVSRVIDDNKKQVYNDDEIVQTYFRRLAEQTPFRSLLDNQTNAQGDTKKLTQPWTGVDAIDRVITQMISPSKIVDETGTKITNAEAGENNNLSEEANDEYNRLVNEFPYTNEDGDNYADNHWLRNSPPSTLYYGDESVTLSTEEKKEYGGEWSNIWTSGANEMTNNSIYSSLDDEGKADALYQVQRIATNYIQYQYGTENDKELTDTQKESAKIVEFCTTNGKLDGDKLSLIALATATDNDNKNAFFREVDEDGNTIRNSSAKNVRKAYEEAGIYDDILAYLEEHEDVEPSTFGLSKTVIKMDSVDDETSEDATKETKKSSSKSSSSNKTTTSKSSTSKSTSTNSSSSNNTASSTTPTYADAYRSVFGSRVSNNGSSTYSDAGTTVRCWNCGNTVNPVNGKCPVCGANL